MSGIFISYRREDSQQVAGRLFDRLAQHFGKERVFRDIDTIAPGAKFAQVIAERVGACDALVALIGERWLDAKDAQGRRRLDLPDDFVRAEIAEALAQNKLVIPVLIEGTPMPARNALPPEIAALADFNALPIGDARFDFDVGRLTSVIGKVIPTASAAVTSPAPLALVQDWLRRRGLIGLVVLSVGTIWWQWDHVIKLPGVEPLVARITEKALPSPVPGKFNIAVAHLEGDEKRETERLILESLAEFPSVATLPFDRLVVSGQGDREKAERAGHERARALLKASGADVLIWGVVLRQGDKSVPKLYWTPAQAVARAPLAGRYQLSEALNLPDIFWQDLTTVLGLLVASSDAEFAAQGGRYTADTLKPFIERVRGLLRSSRAEQWSAATRAQVLFILGGTLVTYGDQSGQNEPLQEAVAAYREALEERTREKVPIDWAVTQAGLGVALLALGTREAGPARFEEAVAAIREAHKEITREKDPLKWAETQVMLGMALGALGEREPGPARLEEAVVAYREALKEFTREKTPLQWAGTQHMLGTALRALGERDPGPARLEEAVVAYREALKEFTRQRVPLPWAGTQLMLGTALRALGEREPGPARLEEAVAACREALKEFTREKTPLQWAATQINLGDALLSMGERESGLARLEAAAIAYELALPVLRAAKVDYQFIERNLERVREEISRHKEEKKAVVEKSK
jgi:tetratricopeptide (TPR) repeat protein